MDPEFARNREILLFADDLFSYLMAKTGIAGYFPSSIPVAGEISAFTEVIGKAVLFTWRCMRYDLRKYFNFVNPCFMNNRATMISHITGICHELFCGRREQFCFLLDMTALVLEVFSFIQTRGFNEYAYCVPLCWGDVFKQVFGELFFVQGGWQMLNFEAEFRAELYDKYFAERECSSDPTSDNLSVVMEFEDLSASSPSSESLQSDESDDQYKKLPRKKGKYSGSVTTEAANETSSSSSEENEWLEKTNTHQCIICQESSQNGSTEKFQSKTATIESARRKLVFSASKQSQQQDINPCPSYETNLKSRTNDKRNSKLESVQLSTVRRRLKYSPQHENLISASEITNDSSCSSHLDFGSFEIASILSNSDCFRAAENITRSRTIDPQFSENLTSGRILDPQSTENITSSSILDLRLTENITSSRTNVLQPIKNITSNRTIDPRSTENITSSRTIDPQFSENVTSGRILDPQSTENVTSSSILDLRLTENITSSRTNVLQPIENITSNRTIDPRSTENITSSRTVDSQSTENISNKIIASQCEMLSLANDIDQAFGAVAMRFSKDDAQDLNISEPKQAYKMASPQESNDNPDQSEVSGSTSEEKQRSARAKMKWKKLKRERRKIKSKWSKLKMHKKKRKTSTNNGEK